MTFAGGPIFQICWVIDDIAGAEQAFGAHFGIEKWMRIDDVQFSHGSDEALIERVLLNGADVT